MAEQEFDHLLPDFNGTSVQAFLEDCAASIGDRQAALRREVAATVQSHLSGALCASQCSFFSSRMCVMRPCTALCCATRSCATAGSPGSASQIAGPSHPHRALRHSW